jgi:hypothetical protein
MVTLVPDDHLFAEIDTPLSLQNPEMEDSEYASYKLVPGPTGSSC